MPFDPGVGEIEWLADLKQVAEETAREILGRPVEWKVESLRARGPKRNDVRVLDEHGLVLMVGEAKRPSDPDGAHALVTKVVDDALSKAQDRHAPFAFTTNFHEIALLDASTGVASHFERLRGNPVALVDPDLANAPGWWQAMSREERDHGVGSGFRSFFSNYLAALSGQKIPVSIDDVVLSFLQALTDRLVEHYHPLIVRAREARLLPSDLLQHALRVHLDIGANLDCRFLAAQAIAEVVTAALFYQILQDPFDLVALTNVVQDAGQTSLHEAVAGALETATNLSGDYQSIFSVSPAAHWLLDHAEGEAVSLWMSVLTFVSRISLQQTSSEILGTIFQRLISPERRRKMGQHYTQPRVARCMVEWAIRGEQDVVLDTACGAGTFLVEAYEWFRRRKLPHDVILRQVFGNDLDPFAVHLASINLATRELKYGPNYPAVRLGDAFDMAPHVPCLTIHNQDGVPTVVELPEVNVVVGNPPYGLRPDDPIRLNNLIGRLNIGSMIPLPEMKNGNLAAWFMPLAAGLVGAEHRIALLMTVGVLQNDNLAEWRSWLRTNWDLVIWHTESDVWFSDARIATCAILATPRPSGQQGVGRLRFVNVEERVAGTLTLVDGVPTPTARSVVRDLTALPEREDMLVAGTKPQILRQFEESPAVKPLGQLQDAGVKTATGKKLGHAFFKLKELEPGQQRQVSRLEGVGTEIRLPREYHRPLLSSPKQIVTGEVVDTGTRLLTLPAQLPRNRQVRGYLRQGLRIGVDQAPSIEARGGSWWSIDALPSRIAVPLHYQFKHQLAWFAEPGLANNNFHTIRFDERVTDIAQELVGACLASAIGALSWLYISEEVGCEGARTVALFHLLTWHVLDPSRAYDPELVGRTLDTYRSFRQKDAKEIDSCDGEAIDEWTLLTRYVSELAGMPLPDTYARQVVAECVRTVARRRAREAAALTGRGPGGRSQTIENRTRAWLKGRPETETVVALLTSGGQTMTLRPVAVLRQVTFAVDQDPRIGPEQEEVLSRLLGSPFECAPPNPQAEPQSWQQLVTVLDNLLRVAVESLVGAAPSSAIPDALASWQELADRVQRAAIRFLQSEVRVLLH